MVLNEESDKQGVYAVSVVNAPAIEEDWVALNKHLVEVKSIDEEKRVLMGAALIPNKQMYRKDEKIGEFYIYFSKDAIEKASQLFLKRNKQNNATYEHMKEIEGMSVVESWIIEDENQDKSRKYGFDLPVGTWMISMKVNNDDVWKDVKEGKVKGFSIEGYFADKYEMSIKQTEDDILIEKIKEIIRNGEAN